MFRHKLTNFLSFHYNHLFGEWSFPPKMPHHTARKIITRNYEIEVTEAIQSILQKKDVFIDVGANIGYFSRQAAELVGGDGRVVSIEPGFQNFTSLIKNTIHYPQVIPLLIAMDQESLLVDLNLSTHSSCHSLMSTENYLSKKSRTVPTLTLDFIWDKYLDRNPIKLIKIDVEGAEIRVLEGAEDCLKNGAIQHIILEFCPEIMHSDEIDPMQYFNLLSEFFDLKVLGRDYKPQGGETYLNEKSFVNLTKRLLSIGNTANANLIGFFKK
ncbi:FkbM family methyltransferase [Rhodohalobacter sp.]|uniref:FkbM family methyltransferase n=1 Tax=Rhodohalobacter sp. TaxID=1974210 RepID=UPI003561B837